MLSSLILANNLAYTYFLAKLRTMTMGICILQQLGFFELQDLYHSKGQIETVTWFWRGRHGTVCSEKRCYDLLFLPPKL